MSRGPKVLLIETEPGISRLAQANLRRAGCDVLTARSDVEAQQIAADQTPDIVVRLDDDGLRRLTEFLRMHPPEK